MKKIVEFAYSAIVYVMFLGTFLYAVGFTGNLVVPKSIDSGAEQNTATALLINALLLGLFAIQHSVMARPGFKACWTKIIPKTIERSTYVLATNLCLILLYWKWVPLKGIIWDVQIPIVAGFMWALFTLGWLIVLITTFSINHFDLFGTRQTFYPLVKKEAPPIAFMKKGLYKFCRHPIMLGFIIAMFASPTMSVGHLFFAVMATAYIFIALIFEERDLENALGEHYKEYQKTTPKICPFSFFKKTT